MKRQHLFEFIDQPWLPDSIRNAATDYLYYVSRVTNPYQLAIERFSQALQHSRTSTIVDLCSGAGGPWLFLKSQIDKDAAQPYQLYLTDYYPHPSTLVEQGAPAATEYFPQSVDARCVPKQLSGFRTMFAGFHHFALDDARAILRNAVESRQGIAIFELTERSLLAILLILISPMFVLLVTPMIRPFRWSRIFWTYLIPIVPFVVGFDGVVSCLRTYSPSELTEMTDAISGPDYCWQSGHESIPNSPMRITYLIGYPKQISHEGHEGHEV